MIIMTALHKKQIWLKISQALNSELRFTKGYNIITTRLLWERYKQTIKFVFIKKGRILTENDK